MDAALEVQDLNLAFGDRQVLRGVSFSLAPGSVLAVIGPNGAGKTALFQALAGMLPFEGQVRWAPGTRLGYVPQKLDLERDLPLTGLDFMRAKARVVRAPAGHVATLLERVGLGPASAHQPIGALSGGQFQRLLLAAALLGEPNTLLLDEVTAGVDEPGQERMYELIHDLAGGGRRTVLLISHELSVVYRHATHVLCLARRRAFFGVPRELLTPELLNEVYGSSQYHVHPPR